MNSRSNDNHPWKRIQTAWAFPAWVNRNPEEAKAVEERHRKERKRKEYMRKYNQELRDIRAKFPRTRTVPVDIGMEVEI